MVLELVKPVPIALDVDLSTYSAPQPPELSVHVGDVVETAASIYLPHESVEPAS